MALFIFWYKLDWTAGTGYVDFTHSPTQWASHLLLPWIVLALLYAAIYARMVRGNLLDTMGEDFIRTARAKGLSERRVIFRHGLRASLAPIVTMFGLDIALLVGGAVITESVFNLDGLGFMAIDSVYRKDLPGVLGVVLLATVAVVIANLLVDVAYAFLDPRVRYA
jgi:peptide/nickel transport system permease protein